MRVSRVQIGNLSHDAGMDVELVIPERPGTDDASEFASNRTQ